MEFLLATLFALSLQRPAEPVNGFYTSAIGTTQQGELYFPGNVLSLVVADVLYNPRREVPQGTIIDLHRTVDNQLVMDDLLLHKNGRSGNIDLTRDTLVITAQDIIRLPARVQQFLSTVEIMPEGFTRR